MNSQITVDFTDEHAKHLDEIVAYFGSGRFGVQITNEDAVRIAMRELAERVKPNQIINDCGFTDQERQEMHGKT